MLKKVKLPFSDYVNEKNE